MTLVRSRSTDFFPHTVMSSATRKLQEALYTHLEDMEKSAFIEALSSYGTQRDIFELVNELRKILNTPVKRRLFPLVRQVIRQADVEAFDLLTRGDKLQTSTLPRPYLYRPHIADLMVLKKHRASSLSGGRSRSRHRDGNWSSTTKSSGAKSRSQNEPLHQIHGGGASGRDEKHKTLSRRSASMKREDEGEVIEMEIGTPDDENGGFGFTIRGGHEHKVGVYVSSVDKGSSAHECGLMAGDLILEANNINFRNIAHDEAALLIKAATYLVLTVSRVGRIPDSHTVLETFRWTDPKGRPVSPPGGWEGGDLEDDDGRGRAGGGGTIDDEGRMRSGTLMLKGRDERKVNVVVERGHGLGLMVRGGKEYKLGIFISAIDPFSVAANAGLKIGDQILDVNGKSFLGITHKEAVYHLKCGRHLMMTVKDVGKIPFAKTTIDETGWVHSSKFNTYVNSVSSSRSVEESLSDAVDLKERGFSKGAGSQLMRSSTVPSVRQQRELIHDQASLLLNEREQMTLNYYISEYEKKTINLSGFAHALFEILNTPAKMTLLSELRTAIQPKDLNEFDQIILEKEMQTSLTEAREMLAPDILSIGSFDSHDAVTRRKSKRTLFSQQIRKPDPPQRMDKVDFGEERSSSPINFNLLAASSRLSRSTPSLPSLSPLTRNEVRPNRERSSSSSRPTSPNSAYQLMAQTSRNNRVTTRAGANGRVEDPSDDSGVDINNHFNHTQDNNPTSPVYQSGRMTFAPVKPKIYQGGYAKNLSSPQKKILNHLQRKEEYNLISKREGGGRGGGGGGREMNNPDQSSRRYVSSPSSTSSRPARHIEHVVDVHRSQGDVDNHDNNNFNLDDDDDDDDDDTLVENKGGYRSTISAAHRSRSLQRNHRSGDNRSRSRSKSRAKSSDAAIARRGIKSRGKSSSLERHLMDSRESSTANEIQQFKSYRDPSNDRDNFPHNDLSLYHHHHHQHHRRNESSSSSTVVNSVRSQSTLTINGQPVSPRHSAKITTKQGGSKFSNTAFSKRDPKRNNEFTTDSDGTTSIQITGNNKKKSLLAPPVAYSPPTSKRLQSLNSQPSRSSRSKKSRSPKITRSPNVPRRHTRAEELFSKQEVKEEQNLLSYPESSIESSPRNDFYSGTLRYASQNTSNSSDFGNTIEKPHKNNSLSLRIRNAMGGAKQKSHDFRPSNRNEKPSKSSVPLIRIDSKSLPKVEAATLRSSIKGQNPTTSVTADIYAVPYKPAEGSKNKRVTISDIAVEINTVSENDVSSVVPSNTRLPTNDNNSSTNQNATTNRPSTKSRIEVIKDKAVDKYGELPLQVVYIYRSKPTLGVAIEGGANTRQPLPRVINVQPGGSAFESGGLKVGHVILEVNGTPAVGLSHIDAARLVAEAFKNKESDRMELLVTQWSDDLLDVIKVDADLLKVASG